MTDGMLLQQLLDASRSFREAWRSTSEAAPTSEPATLEDAMFDLAALILQLLVRDRQHELEPLLAALERFHEASTPAQRGLLRDHVFATLRDWCQQAGMSPELLLGRFGPQSRATWLAVSLS